MGRSLRHAGPKAAPVSRSAPKGAGSRGAGAPSVEARLRSAFAQAAPADEIAGLLEELGRGQLSRRRRLQAEGLHGALAHLAALLAACGWTGSVVIDDGKALVEQDGVRLLAEPEHFRTAGSPRGATLLAPLRTFGIRPRLIVDLTPGSGEVALYLARRLPGARVVAADPSPGLVMNFAWQDPPLDNVRLARTAPANGLQALCRAQGVSTIDLLRLDAPPDAQALAASIAGMAGRIRAACVTFTGKADDHLGLLAAFARAGMVLCEKASRPVDDPGPWLREGLSQRGAVTAWFVARSQLQRQATPPARAAAKLRALARNPASAKGWIYARLDERAQRRDPPDRRFEFETLYAENPDPWDYLTSGYEERKYRRTLEAALRLRPHARSALEIGCSIGVFTRVLARTYPQVVASDIAAEALARARRHVGRAGRVRYVRGDIGALDLGAAFDLIFCAEMLYYVDDKAAPAAVDSLKRALAPGGLLFTVFPCMPHAGEHDPGPRWKQRLVQRGLRTHWEETIRDGRRRYVIQAYAHGDESSDSDIQPR